MKRKFGFTLSEVLITMVIIGVVAAMTVGIIIPSVQKKRVETRLSGFYSKINQAMMLAYIDYGEHPELARSDYTYSQNVDWLKNYLLPHLNYYSVKNCNDPNQYRRNAACVKLINGDLFEFVVDYNGADILYFPYGEWVNIETDKMVRHKVFAFQFSKRAKANSDDVIKSKNYIEPYTYKWNGNINDLYNNKEYGCAKGKKKFYCAKIIQLNSWEIPKRYPW